MSLFLILALALAEPPAEQPPSAEAAAAAGAADIHQKVVTAIRNCPETKGDEIVVCSKDRGIAESFRLPKLDPRFAQSDPKLRKPADAFEGTGDGGFGSCSAVGIGAGTGCAMRDYRAWGDWKRRQRALREAAEADASGR
ncbi:hypothetical protein HL653_02810 [Sphingomonas sp. AP4-R1]|uniref:hypothetical protein n=1 Tax=Sphingomonas sp. AP4-R1 TaxID=2735134 RepID=UPI0014939349|nr:hypothetical protein [Sphingomonas sp. AP4-R1]QJU56863.1 hypothetical protein HL653_02810 [Sphingomonas sp. AP4-R1]